MFVSLVWFGFCLNLKKKTNYEISIGIARGGVPFAIIAIYVTYKINKCRNKDILAAFDDAISNGVKIISVSI